MLAFFNKNSFSAIAFSVIVAAGLWIPDFGSVPPVSDDVAMMPLEAMIAQWVGLNPLLAAIAVPLALLIFSLIIVKIELTYLITVQRLYLAPFVYVLLCSAFPAQEYINGAYFAAMLFAAALFCMFRLYKAPRTLANIFYAGLLISMAAMFYAPAALLVILLPLALILFRQVFSWREHIIALLGAITPFFYLCAGYFLMDYSVEYFFNTLYKSLFTLSSLIYENTYVTEKIYLAYVMFLMLQAFWLLMHGLLTSKQNVKKIHILLLWTFFIVLCISLLLPAGSMQMMPLLSLPACILIANYFIFAKNRRWAGLQFLVLIAITVWIRFFSI
jgi:hypothetical protein